MAVAKKRSTVKKRVSKKATAKKTALKRTAAKKTTAKRTAAKKTTAKKTAVKKTTAKKTVKKSTPKSLKAKTAKKATVKIKAKGMTDTDKVLKIIKRSKKGVAVATLRNKTGFNDKKISNIVYRAFSTGKIKRVEKGIYKAA